LYGFGSKDAAKFLKVAGHPELVFVRDAELNYQQVMMPVAPHSAQHAGSNQMWHNFCTRVMTIILLQLSCSHFALIFAGIL
jgi:hypothetical protein